jgi:hypothetical protein
MKAVITRYQCYVPLTPKQWKKLDNLDFLDDVEPEFKGLAYEIDYHGMFGRYFFFTVDKEKDIEKVVKILEKLLNGNLSAQKGPA